MGNIRWGTYTAYSASANKSDTAASVTDSGISTTRDALGSYTRGPDGRVSDVQLPFGTRFGTTDERSTGLENAHSGERFARSSVTDSAGWTQGQASVQTFGGAIALARSLQDQLVGSWGGQLNIADSLRAGHIVR